MKETVPRLDAETLMEHREFVRAVVRRLVADEHQVDDVVQETWMTPTALPSISGPGLS